MRIKNALQVRVVSDFMQAKSYYENSLGFSVDDWGHAVREGVGFLLQQADKPEDVRPNAATSPRSDYPADWKGPPTSWDTYVYADFEGVQCLYEEFLTKGAILAYGPLVEELGGGKRKEFAVKDADGYVIAFGGSDT